MAGLCCGVNLGEAEGATAVETIPSSKTSLRKRVEMHNFNFLPMDSAVAPVLEGGGKRMKCKIDPAVVPIISPRPRLNDSADSETGKGTEKSSSGSGSEVDLSSGIPKFGMTSVCGRRRDMEDAVAIHPSLFGKNQDCPSGLHFFGVYDGHGCSHVAARCRDRMHEIVKAEHESGGTSSWEETMVTSFAKMDKEVGAWCSSGSETSSCRCELKTPQCDAVGSTAVVAVVTPDKIIVSNCGDSRAVLCRNGVAIPLSVDHKPDRPDELNRIQEAGGRVIFWDGPRVLGMLAMSRAIGDNYLKPYVISEPEVTIYDRTAEDECLILASDGLWDVVSNETACGVARACLQSRSWSSQKSCGDASILLTKLALARLTADNVSVVVVDLRSPPTPRD